MSVHRDSTDDIHSAVENKNTVSAYFTSEQILSFGFAELYCCAVHVIDHHVCRCHSANSRIK